MINNNNQINDINNTIKIRVHIAQCKLYGICNKKDKNKAFRELYQLRNYSESYYPLACYYEEEEKNGEKALEYFEKCHNNSLAKYRMSIILFKQYKLEIALNYLILSANEGNKFAQFILAVYYHHGILVNQSIDLAKFWYEKSAIQGLAEAQFSLANLLLNEIEYKTCLEENKTRLVDNIKYWLLKATAQKNASALIRLGSLHEEGILVEQDNYKALNYYHQAILSPIVYPSVLPLAHYLIGINYTRLGTLGQKQDLSMAIYHLIESSELGYAPAQRTLGIMYAEGIDIKKDIDKARSLLELAASQNDIQSLSFIAHIEKSLDAYQRAAEAGSLTSQFILAQMYQSNHQYALALKWFKIASQNIQVNSSVLDQQINNTARLMIARYRYNGWGGIEKNVDLAVKEFIDLSRLGFSDAYYWLAAWYEEVKINLEKAHEFYMKGAIAEDIDCQFQVAYMLSNGYKRNNHHWVKDIEAAYGWYLKAAKAGHKTAQYNIGLYYEYGLNRDINIQKAVYWYKLSAENNSTLAMVRLARLLDDSIESVNWLTRAIDLGDITAIRELATFYKNGLIEGDLQLKKAMDLFQQAALKNDAMSWHALSEFYEYGFVDPIDIEKAISCLIKSEALGYSVAGLSLAEFYFRNEMVNESLELYRRLSENIELNICYKARIEFSKLIAFEKYGNEIDQITAYNWLVQMLQLKQIKLAQVYEILGYFSENGIGIDPNKSDALHWYTSCVEQKEFDWAKQRSLCRLVNFYIEDQDYSSAFKYLEKLKPDLNEMSQLSDDATMQATRMKYYLGYMLMHGLGTHSVLSEGITWLTFAADEGDHDASYELGGYYISIYEEEEAKHRYEEGIGHAGCMRALALLLLSEENDIPDEQNEYEEAVTILKLFEEAAELGDVIAIYQLGLIYEHGLGTIVTKDIEKSLSFYIQAANMSYELAIIKTGEILGNIMGQYTKAIIWFQKAIHLYNNLKAKILLISYGFQGYDVTCKDDTFYFCKLKLLIEKEIEKNDTEDNRSSLGLAFYILGQCYEIGKGTTVNLALSKEWYHRSVFISQNVDAMWRLGVIYNTLELNQPQALEWFRNAAEKGRHCESHYQLGLFHLNGMGNLEKNIITAQKYFSKASDQGHPLATYELAHIIWNHKKDYILGYELYKLAGKLQIPDALRGLGHLSHTGFIYQGIKIVVQDYKRAFAYYCEAAQLGDSTAALMVGNYFEEGYLKEELGKNCERALQWYESAYKLNGGGLAELAIGKIKHIMANNIVDINEAEDMREEAFVWFESAANNQNNTISIVFAKIMIALYHLNGWGRKIKDTKIGFNMLLEIAKSGGVEANVTIAECYEKGVGIKHDMMKALHYCKMATNNNKEDAQNYYDNIGTIRKKVSIESFSSSSSSVSLFSEKTLP